MLFSIMIGTGYLFIGSLAWIPWRWISFSLIMASACAFGVILFIPESPYFLLKKYLIVAAADDPTISDRAEDYRCQAEKCLQQLRGKDYDVLPELNKIEAEILLMGSKTTRIADDLRLPGVYKPVLLGIVLMIFQQFSGHNAVLFYSGINPR